MAIVVGTGPGEYPPVIQYVVNGEPADDITFNRPTTDLDARTEALRLCVTNIQIADVAGLSAALNGASPLHPNLGQITALDYGANPNFIFAIDGAGIATLIPNTLQGENNTASNVGTGLGSVFKQKVALDLQFKTIKQGGGITVTNLTDEVEISANLQEAPTISKLVKNTTGAVIPQFSVLAWLDDGTVTLGDANIMAISDFAGVTLEAINDTEVGRAAKLGDVPGAVASLGATVGDYVYMGETPGTMSLVAPPGLNDTILILGRAEPSSGIASVNPPNLFLQPSYLTEGGA
jgi:hypothetical protein